MAAAIFEATVQAAFPEMPVPEQVLLDPKHSAQDDVAEEIAGRFEGRPWPALTMDDWGELGTSPAVARLWFTPAAFRYYLPSLLLGAANNTDYLRSALEAILPGNQRHERRRGDVWWAEFEAGMSPHQRSALAQFIHLGREDERDRGGPFAGNDPEADAADRFWVAPE
jgi:hypothetical protein